MKRKNIRQQQWSQSMKRLPDNATVTDGYFRTMLPGFIRSEARKASR